jgi:nucleotide-binding universal stress UspA family protein
MGKDIIYKNMLLPLDGSKEAEEKLDEAISLIKLTGGELILLHVVELFPFRGQDQEAEYNHIKGPREEYLNKIKARVEGEGLKVRAVVLPGKPAEEICRYAAKDEVDIVLVSPHGVGGIVGWALGSVADKVARHCPKPVLVIRRSGKYVGKAM